jgi:hypothetical protein
MLGPELVPNGLGCGCICAGCRQPLVAKQGKVKEWHFAHSVGGDCVGAVESAIHRMAKQMIMERRAIYVPPYVIRRHIGGQTWQRHLEEVAQAEGLLNLRSCREEPRLDTRQPDILAVMPDGHEIAIEVAFTHFCDEEKIGWLKARGLTTLEIDVSLPPETKANEVEGILTKRLFESASRSVWLHHANEQHALARLDEQEAALRQQNAEADAEHEAKEKAAKAEQERKDAFRASVRDVAERTFRLDRDLTLRVAHSKARVTMKGHGYFKNVAPEMKQMILDAANHFGGRFNKEYKVWEFWPPETHVAQFCDELCHFIRVQFDTLSSLSPEPASTPSPAVPARPVSTRLALTEDEHELFEERAAILEFDGRMLRDEAEEHAYGEIIRMRWKRLKFGS